MGKAININEIAEQLLKQYRDIPSLDKAQKLLTQKYGSSRFADIRKRFAQLWLKQNGIEVNQPQPKKKQHVTVKVGQKSAVLKNIPKPLPKKKPVIIKRSNVPVPKIMQDIKGDKIVTNWVDPEDNMQPVQVKLQVLRTMTFGGRLCYVVKYGPNGVAPYEWHIPIDNKAYENLQEIPCIYHKHTLVFDKDSPSLKSNKTIARPSITTKVKVLSSSIQPSKTIVKTGSASKVTYKSELPPQTYYRKSPEQWYAEVGMYDKHKCGKPFVCSCCGQSFAKNQGYRIDLKEIYFCFDCKKKIYKPSNSGWRGSVISIPMGNKR